MDQIAEVGKGGVSVLGTWVGQGANSAGCARGRAGRVQMSPEHLPVAAERVSTSVGGFGVTPDCVPVAPGRAWRGAGRVPTASARVWLTTGRGPMTAERIWLTAERVSASAGRVWVSPGRFPLTPEWPLQGPGRL